MNEKLTPAEAIVRRTAVILHPFTDQKKEYNGTEIYSVTEKGIVIAVGKTRLFYPWHRVNSFNYHVDDVQARELIQGY